MSQVIERVRLAYCAGRSDKVYEIELITVGQGLFHVVGYNGRRGASLVAQPKTRQAVPYVTARRIFDQLEQVKRHHRQTPYQLRERQTFPVTESPAQNLAANSVPHLAANPAPHPTPTRPAPLAATVAPVYQAGHLDALEL